MKIRFKSTVYDHQRGISVTEQDRSTLVPNTGLAGIVVRRLPKSPAEKAVLKDAAQKYLAELQDLASTGLYIPLSAVAAVYGDYNDLRTSFD
jgi:hypothetical protein